MQTKLTVVALAIAAALPLPVLADNANVTIYGIANLSVDMTKNGNTATAQGTGANKISSNASRIGLKGAEEIGEGLNAIWQVESRVDMDNAGGTLGTRNTFVGLKNDEWGQVILGIYDSPYKIATRRLDVFGDSMADNRALMGGAVGGKNSALKFDGRFKDIVMYSSPSWGGVTLHAAYTAGAEATSTSTDIKGKTMSVAGLYENGALFGSLSYQRNDIGSLGTGNNAGTNASGSVGVKEKAVKVGVGYKLEMVEAGLVYEKTSDNINIPSSVFTCTSGSTDSNCYGHKALTASGKLKMDNHAIKVAYSKAGDLGNKTSSGANQLAVGYDYGLSKRTTLYALYTRLSNNTNASYALAAGDGGTNTGFVTAKGADADPKAISFGIKHTF